MLSNILWGKLSSTGKNRLIVLLSYFLIIIVVILSVLAKHIYYYYFVFFIAGAAIDGFRLAFSNLILIIAPEDKRPVYIAVQNNITSIGMFFSIPGGALVSHLGFNTVGWFTVGVLVLGLFMSFKLKRA
jgi:predicted MFS family arabinose efflux permease